MDVGDRTRDRWYAFGLVALTFVAYAPALSAGFIWDDDDYVTQNRTLVDFDGLRRIWFEPSATPQYYPLVHTSFWLEYRLVGTAPWLYHATNVALHAAAALLLWRTLRRIEAPGAALAALLFALHPVHVESVAWVTERKNVLSAVFYFAAALAYLRFALDEPAATTPGRRRGWYAVAAVCYVAALLSKTVTFSLPAALAVVVWWKRGRLAWRDVAPLLPLVALAVLPVLATIRLEQEHVGASGAEWDLSPIERVLVAGRALWFYAGKLLFPAPLVFIYPRWTIDASAAWQYLFPLGAVGVLALAWWRREAWGRGPLAALLVFCGTLVPALGFFRVYPMRYSFVADHFQYLASVGLLTLGAAALDRAWKHWRPDRRSLAVAASGVLVLILGTLAFRQCHAYRDVPTLWNDVLAKNPGCWMAHANLAGYLADRGEQAEAERHYEASLALEPRNAEAIVGLATLRLNQRRRDEARGLFERALQVDPTLPITHFYYGLCELQERNFAAASERFERACELNPRFVGARFYRGVALREQGETTAAEAEFRRALELDARHVGAHEQLARIAIDREQWADAQRHLEAAVAAEPDAAPLHQSLGVVLQKRGLTGRAAHHFEQARRLGGGR